jgi:predicted Zn finger-like uncharacterized protein
VARQSGLDEATTQVILSELCSTEILKAKIQIRCPHCRTQYGIFARKSAVPNDTKHCFDCGNSFGIGNERSWEVIYEVANAPGDFFQSRKEYMMYFVDEEKEQPPNFFINELNQFKEMDNARRRGREFDYLMGILFQQLPGVDVRLKETGSAPGEVDAHVVCIDQGNWVYRLLGRHTIVENKWEKDPVETSAISIFRGKTRRLSDCNTTYIASMSGFSRGGRKQTGALTEIRGYSNPKMIDIWRDDIEQMMNDGTPEPLLRERLL